jgi:signal transduction histidine kinase
MSHPHGPTGPTRWWWRAVCAGLALSMPVPIIILASQLVDALRFAYPLCILPLLLAGPVAVRRQSGRVALATAALTGVVSGIVAATSLELGMRLTGFAQWGLVSAASARPMPQLPHVEILSADWLTWPLQDILVFQPLLAVALGALTLAVSPSLRHTTQVAGRFLPGSLAGRLRWAFGGLILLTVMLGLVGFAMIEEMHYRIHQLQLQAAWQHDLSAARVLLDAEIADRFHGAHLTANSATSPAQQEIATIFERLHSTAPRPGVSVGRDGIAAQLERYRPALDDAASAYDAYLRSDGDADALLVASAAFSHLEQVVETDIDDLLSGSDLSHHERLMAVMLLVGLVAGLGLWTSERVVDGIDRPLVALSRHLHRLAQGDFTRRVPNQGPAELRALGHAVNEMTADLARMYAVERERRASAEALATRERELSAAKEFWTNTLVHDLKGPLTLISGWSELLEQGHQGLLDPAQAQAIQHIKQATSALDDLVLDINDSFRLGADALPIHRAPIAPAMLLRRVVDNYRGLDRPVPDLQLSGDLVPVQADARLIGRVLHNLIGNAYKHAGPSAKVALAAEVTADGVRFAVDDDGPGIPENERERVFERFIQGHGARHGSGLGLAFCKLVIDQLGGRIWADASPLGGTRVAFLLPCVRAEVPARITPTSADREVSRVA